MRVLAFGDLVRAFLSTDHAYSLIDADPTTFGLLPLEGACWPIAAALALVLGRDATLAMIVDSGAGHKTADHVLARVGDLYLDGRGAATAEETLRYWHYEERMLGPVLREFVRPPLDVNDPGYLQEGLVLVGLLQGPLRALYDASAGVASGAGDVI
jgi:hypothetical protein